MLKQYSGNPKTVPRGLTYSQVLRVACREMNMHALINRVWLRCDCALAVLLYVLESLYVEAPLTILRTPNQMQETVWSPRSERYCLFTWEVYVSVLKKQVANTLKKGYLLASIRILNIHGTFPLHKSLIIDEKKIFQIIKTFFTIRKMILIRNVN